MAPCRLPRDRLHLRRLRTVRRFYAANVVAVADAVWRFFPEGTLVTRPEGGPVLWVELPPRCVAVRLYEAA